MQKVRPNFLYILCHRISTSISCGMKLHYFPLDSQECAIQLESFGFTTDDLELRWKDIDEPVQTSEFDLPEFVMEKYTLHDCSKEYVTGGTSFSCMVS